ncbi:MAG: taurine dioxygenase [Rhodospirillaceae bacterium TMED8]|nr:taurine dioxygenase [Magnetovibrio sp.]OUT50843.1 MAG: taurine dioxygenase [Rhodospirillaceae bacterium TMED8]
MTITIDPVTAAIGAEIKGVDLSLTLEDQLVSNIRSALLNYKVIFFRDQNITPIQHVTLAKRFGTIVEYPLVKGLEEAPEVIPVVKLEHEIDNFGGMWHTDTSYLDKPPMGAILVARQLPPVGGDTLFSNMVLAYQTLSPGMKKILANLVGISSSCKEEVSKSREARLKTEPGFAKNVQLRAEHPVVRRHPETGERVLYVNYGHTIGLKDMSEEESMSILQYLFEHQRRPEFTCCFRWRPGSIAFWDNRATQHNPINDYHGFKRVMHRITIAGDTPA